MPLYRQETAGLVPVPTTTFAVAGVREREGLQALLRDQLEVVAPDTLVIAEEFGDWDASQRRIDLLAVDRWANLVVIELKRGDTGAHMELQALRYAAMVARITFDQAAAAFEKYLAARGKAGDARALLLEFLEWDEPDEAAFARDVRIVLVAAGFSKELTSTVMWLNERDLDIRCVQVRPHLHHGDLLLDVQQLIPLPQAREYQVQVREKARRERSVRMGDRRDMTRYVVSVGRRESPPLRKRRAVLHAVRSLAQLGVPTDEIARRLKSSRALARFPGTLTSADFADRLRSAPHPREPRRFMIRDEELIHAGGETVALRKGWGRETEATLQALRDAFPAAEIAFRREDAPAAPGDAEDADDGDADEDVGEVEGEDAAE